MNCIPLHALALDDIVAHDGDGTIGFVRLSERYGLRGDWVFVDFARVPVGASVGLHEHADDEELYVVVRGWGIATVDGIEGRVEAPAILVNPPFATHGIRNEGTEPLEFVVLKVRARNPAIV